MPPPLFLLLALSLTPPLSHLSRLSRPSGLSGVSRLWHVYATPLRATRARPPRLSVDADFYSVLGVSEAASAAEIKRAYRRAALRSHPDVNKAPDAQQQFARVVSERAGTCFQKSVCVFLFHSLSLGRAIMATLASVPALPNHTQHVSQPHMSAP
eukprot:scaffold325780_cov55-Tisochrysis_lutea.AAC.1